MPWLPMPTLDMMAMALGWLLGSPCHAPRLADVALLATEQWGEGGQGLGLGTRAGDASM